MNIWIDIQPQAPDIPLKISGSFFLGTQAFLGIVPPNVYFLNIFKQIGGRTVVHPQ